MQIPKWDKRHIVESPEASMNNAPVDIFWDGKGTGNRFLENDCTTSVPPGLCTQNENQH